MSRHPPIKLYFPLKLTTLKPTYSPLHNPKLHHPPFHVGPNKLLRLEEIEASDLKRPRQGLWWSLLKVPAAQCSKSVVRNWATRRVREAFTEALRAKGFGQDGLGLGGNRARGEAKLSEEAQTAWQERSEHQRELTGSLVMRVEAGTITASKETVDREAMMVVDWLEQQEKPIQSASKLKRVNG